MQNRSLTRGRFFALNVTTENVGAHTVRPRAIDDRPYEKTGRYAKTGAVLDFWAVWSIIMVEFI